MPVGHLRLRKAALVVILLLLVGAVVALSVLMILDVYKIIGLSLISVVLFFNVSRRIYPARRILHGEQNNGTEESAENEGEEKSA